MDTIRSVSRDDLGHVVALVAACDAHDVGEADDPESIRIDTVGEWDRAGDDLSRNAWVAEEGGLLVGYALVAPAHLGEAIVEPNGCVLPSHRGRGLGTALVGRAEARAHELAPRPERLRAIVSGENPSAHALFAGRGFELVEQSWQMSIELEAAPASPSWPERVTPRSVRADDERELRELYELIQDAFADSEAYDRSTRTFERWRAFLYPTGADTSRHRVVEAGGELVGAALCPVYPDWGWVRGLAVRRDWRRRGLGRALMQEVFCETWQRGLRRVGLTVDSWNTSGAREFYESIGMRATLQHDKLVKRL